MKRKNLYIPSIEAKDLYAAQHMKNQDSSRGYTLLRSNCMGEGIPNLRKYINSFDYSLDLIDLKAVANKIYESLGSTDTLSFENETHEKEFSNKIINVTFKFSYKEFNKYGKGLYIRQGFSPKEAVWTDGLAWNQHEIIGVKTGIPIRSPIDAVNLPRGFTISTDKAFNKVYVADNTKIPIIIRGSELRKYVYKYGFNVDNVHYVRFKRSSGSSRVGKCLFIDERLYEHMHEAEKCGLEYRDGDKIDLAALEAYIALPTSSIIDILTIKPENILVIDDYTSCFQEEAVVTEADDNGNLHTTQKMADISNSIWDGQSLIDISIMGKYSKKGMLLLRNKFFKSCCFNTNIQQWFKDNGITSVSQLNGKTIAKNISDIKLITTPSSIKYFKFGKFEDWLKNIYPIFGVVKHDKNTHFFGGELVQTHYQLINTLQLSQEDVAALVKPSLDYITLVKTDLDILRYHLRLKMDDWDRLDNVIHGEMSSSFAAIYKMLRFDCGFENTAILKKFRKEACIDYINNMKKGHILVNGTYATLLGNPLEMLQQSIGRYVPDTTSIPAGNVHSTRYEYGTDILGCRSPSVTIGNLLVANNMAHEEIDKYFNLTPQIICINSVGENTLERLSGADFDSDQMIITNNEILIKACKKNYKIFTVPTSNVHASKTVRYYTKEHMADLDNKTGKNKIGEIVNLSQQLNSLLWEKFNAIERANEKAAKLGGIIQDPYEAVREIYYDVCQLDVMSCIEIDFVLLSLGVQECAYKLIH